VFPDQHAERHPDKAAYVVARTGRVVTYAELTARSRQAARVLRGRGAGHGDTVALIAENHERYLEVAWAAQRAGLRYTAISPRLTAEEVEYLLRDADARLLIASAQTADVAGEAAAAAGLDDLICLDDPPAGFDSYEELVAAEPPEALADEAEGVEFLYSSGTTGRPKAIKTELPLTPIGTPPPLVGLIVRLYGFDESTVYLSPAPLYHSAPLRFNMACHRLGGTSIVMDRFEPEWALELVERHGVTHTQMVPTMFVRLLRLPEEERRRGDLSSLGKVFHAAAPCPVDVKQQMIDWLGPIVDEYYSSTEIYLFTAIDAEDWLAHPGSVGRPVIGTPHVLDDDGDELPPGEIGTVWSEGGTQFEYHNAPEKTAEARNERGWTTVGDVGYVDADGYLYLTDRKADLIISGGVNVYPQEAENVLMAHPAVADAAVFGVPHEELGEEVKAVVQLVEPGRLEDEVEAELLAYCHSRLAKYKCPRSIDFVAELPRQATGKLYKRLLREEYRQAARAASAG
jgi:long-chain acyl-CoA synthetase